MYAYDFHIHSTLSPCADLSMTPSAIIQAIKGAGLALFSITDHNATRQYPTLVALLGHDVDRLVPGIEVSVEGFDVLAYFPSVEALYAFDERFQKSLENTGKFKSLRQGIYHIDHQSFTHHEAQDQSKWDYMTLYAHVKKHKGIVIPAHIDRQGSSILDIYRLKDVPYDGLEVSLFFKQDFSVKTTKPIFMNSDAHTLSAIGCNHQRITLKAPTKAMFFELFDA